MSNILQSGEEGGWMHKKWAPWLLALVPAIFAGIFSVAPYVFEKISAPTSKLEYNSISSPEIRTSSNFEKIVSVTLINSGDAKLTNVSLTVAAQNGSVQKASLKRSSGSQSSVVLNKNGALVSVRSMFPREKIGLTLLVKSQVPDISTPIDARSDQVLGKASASIEESPSLFSGLWLVILPMLGAGISSFWLSYLRRNRELAVGVEREDAISVIAAYARIDCLEFVFLDKHDLSFARFADRVFLEAGRDGAILERCIKSLKCLLIVPRIHKASREIIERYLSDLGVTVDDAAREEFESIRKTITDHCQFRLVVRSIFDSPELVLTDC